jgi:hypothetical protein
LDETGSTEKIEKYQDMFFASCEIRIGFLRKTPNEEYAERSAMESNKLYARLLISGNQNLPCDSGRAGSSSEELD